MLEIADAVQFLVSDRAPTSPGVTFWSTAGSVPRSVWGL
jgi:hypothetical protein